VTRKLPSLRFVLPAAIAVLILAVAPTAFAGKGGGGGGKRGGGSTGSGSLSLVLLNSTDNLPHEGQDVTFNISTTATDRPFVTLNCSVGGTWVYSANVGYFADYPWPQRFTLSNGWWTSGPADCTATLYMSKDGTKSTTLATLSFHVDA
jgi:hypothetical protein